MSHIQAVLNHSARRAAPSQIVILSWAALSTSLSDGLQTEFLKQAWSSRQEAKTAGSHFFSYSSNLVGSIVAGSIVPVTFPGGKTIGGSVTANGWQKLKKENNCISPRICITDYFIHSQELHHILVNKYTTNRTKSLSLTFLVECICLTWLSFPVPGSKQSAPYFFFTVFWLSLTIWL